MDIDNKYFWYYAGLTENHKNLTIITSQFPLFNFYGNNIKAKWPYF